MAKEGQIEHKIDALDLGFQGYEEGAQKIFEEAQRAVFFKSAHHHDVSAVDGVTGETPFQFLGQRAVQQDLPQPFQFFRPGIDLAFRCGHQWAAPAAVHEVSIYIRVHVVHLMVLVPAFPCRSAVSIADT